MQNTHQKFNLESWLSKQENGVTYFFLGLVMCIQCSLYLGQYATSVVFFFIAIFTFSTAMLWVHKQVSYPEFRFLLLINSIFKFDLPIMSQAYKKNLSQLTKGMDDDLKEHTAKIVNAWREYALFATQTEANTEELIDWLCPTKKELTLKVFEHINYQEFLGAFYYYVSSLSTGSREELLNAIHSNKEYDRTKVLDFISLIFNVLPNPDDLNDVAKYKLAKDLKFHLNGSMSPDNERTTLTNMNIIKKFYQENQEIFNNKVSTNGFMILFFSKFYRIDDETEVFISQIDLKVSIENIANASKNDEIPYEVEAFKL